MTIEDLLLKELETVKDMYRFHHELKHKTLNLFFTIFVFLLSFVVKGDLPQKFYLLMAFLLLLSAVFHSRLDNNEACALDAMRVSEMKLHEWAKANFKEAEVFNILPRITYLRHSAYSSGPLRRAMQIASIIFLLACYVFFAYRGLQALNLNIILKTLLMTFLIAAVIGFATLSRMQILTRKKRLSQLLNKEVSPGY